MPRGRVKTRWLVAAVACFVVLACAVWPGIWRGREVFWVSPLERGMIAYDRRDWPAAERAARGELARDRQNPGAVRLLARALYRQGRDHTAVALSQRLPAINWQAEDYFLSGQASVRTDNVGLALEAWQKGIELDSNHLETRVALEQVLFRSGRLSEAELQANALLAKPDREALGELMIGQIRDRQSDPAGAVRALTRSLDRPDQWSHLVEPSLAHTLLARALLRTGRPALARAQLRQVTETARNAETCWLLTRCDLQEAAPSEAAVLTESHSYRQLHPLEPEPAPFVGEGRCASCHAQIYGDQNKSRHAHTFFSGQNLPVIPYPGGPIADPQNAQVTHTFERRADGLHIKSQADGQAYQTIVDYAFGSGDKGLTLVGHDPEHQSFECRLSFYPDKIGWDVTSGQVLNGDGDRALYQGKPLSVDDVRHCVDCHTTDGRKIQAGENIESSDRAIGCERCHGPGANHLKVASNAAAAPGRDLDLAIARPSLASGTAVVGLCAECHSPPNKSLRLTPGSPDSIRFQGTTLTWSRCYTEGDGTLSCLTCHNPHRDATTSPRDYESRCLRCHSPSGVTSTRADGSTSGTEGRPPSSCPIDSARGCIGCHMPRSETAMAHTAFTDHYIRVHPGSGVQTKQRP